MDALAYLFVGIFGLIIGSFLGALTYRLPKGLSIAAGRSFCPQCKKPIAWFDNIPLISFALLNGRCRNCHKKISSREPSIELATALGFITIYTLKGFTLQAALFAVLFSVLVAIFVIDLEHQIIPDSLVFLLLPIAYFVIPGSFSIYMHLLAGFGAGLFLLTIHLITSGRGMGLGDVKFAVAGGFLLGWPETVGWLFLAFLTGGAVGVILLLTGKARLGKRIAFGPFLVISLLVALFYGNSLTNLFFLI